MNNTQRIKFYKRYFKSFLYQTIKYAGMMIGCIYILYDNKTVDLPIKVMVGALFIDMLMNDFKDYLDKSIESIKKLTMDKGSNDE